MGEFMLTTILGFGLIVFFFATEKRQRQGQDAARLDRGPFDRGSTALIAVLSLATFVVLLGALFLHESQSLVLRWFGIVLMISGIGLRMWATRTLGRFYTRTLLVSRGHQIVQDGPYQIIRNPGYLGDIVMWIGAALAIGSLIAVPIVIVLLGIAYSYRIRVEEDMLFVMLGAAYQSYRAKTWRLIPLIY